MNKYDEPLELTYENSLSLIVDQIGTNSVVLEFGPAMGRLTKYLTKELNCEVYIAEIDEEAYHYVMNYAKDGILGDVENYEWFQKFSDISFDYIIFADVLEHLIHPEKVLAKAAELLKNDGRVLTSIPNIAHNAVIIDLLNNKFQYRNTGLLDNTHVKFFAYESLEQFFRSAELVIEKEKIVHVNVENAGLDNCYEMLPKEQENYLKNRDFADAYQFVCTAIKDEYYQSHQETICIEKATSVGFDTMSAILYVDTGNGFNEEEKFQQNYRIENNNSFRVEFTFEELRSVRQLRIDLSYEPCYLQDIKVASNSSLSITQYGIPGENRVYFLNESASIYAEHSGKKSISRIEVSGVLGQPVLAEAVMLLNDKLQESASENNRLEQVTMSLNNKLQEYASENNHLEQVTMSLNNKLQEYASENNRLEQVAMSLNEKLQEYANENNRLEHAILYKQTEIQNAVDMYEDKRRVIDDLNKIISEFSKTVSDMNNIIIDLQRANIGLTEEIARKKNRFKKLIKRVMLRK